MPFIVIFNIVVAVLVVLDLLVIVFSSLFMPRIKKGGDVSASKQAEIEKLTRVKFYAYIVFFAVLILMILVNLIF